MRASQVSVRGLQSYSDCLDAIEAIEGDYLNTAGGHAAWTSGHQTYLTGTAEKKVAGIQRRMDAFPDDEEPTS